MVFVRNASILPRHLLIYATDGRRTGRREEGRDNRVGVWWIGGGRRGKLKRLTLIKCKRVGNAESLEQPAGWVAMETARFREMLENGKSLRPPCKCYNMGSGVGARKRRDSETKWIQRQSAGRTNTDKIAEM